MLLQALMAEVAPLQAPLFETRQLQFQKLLSYKKITKLEHITMFELCASLLTQI